MQPLKICIFTETYFPVIGGGETQAQLLADGLIANGHAVIILTRRSDRKLKQVEWIRSTQVYRLPPSGGGQLKKWGLLISGFLKLIQLHKQYDIIFVSGFRIIGLPAVLVSKLTQKFCVLKADSQGEMSGEFFISGLEKKGFSPAFLPFRVFLNIRNLVLRKADAFSAISEDVKAEFISSRVAPEKIVLIPNGVDTNRFFPVSLGQKRELRNNLSLPEKSTIVVYTGRLVSYKGLPLLLKVWKDIQNLHDDARLILIGTGGLDIHNCESELRSFVITNNLERSIHFTGGVQNAHEYLQASDIFAFPTENDAFPSSLIEALACGLPVVTTPIGAIKNIIKNKENGLVIKPGDYQQLFQALDILISNKVLGSQLGQAAWKTVRDNYSSEFITNQYLSLFKSLLFQSNAQIFP
jgi:glycosyltransferase involved in cell wall biosynthesis